MRDKSAPLKPLLIIKLETLNPIINDLQKNRNKITGNPITEMPKIQIKNKKKK